MEETVIIVTKKNLFFIFYPMINFTCWNRSWNTICRCSIEIITCNICHSRSKYSFETWKYISSSSSSSSCCISSLFIRWIGYFIITIRWWKWASIIFNCIRPLTWLNFSMMRKRKLLIFFCLSMKISLLIVSFNFRIEHI